MSLHIIMENPIQFFGLMYLESFKSLFWAKDYNFQVAYPDWLDAIYRHKDAFMVVAFIFALMTILAYGNLAWGSIRMVRKFWAYRVSCREAYGFYIRFDQCLHCFLCADLYHPALYLASRAIISGDDSIMF